MSQDGGRPNSAVADAIEAPSVAAVRLRGLLGQRLDLMRENRLHHHEDEFLLWPFRHPIPPGDQREDYYAPGTVANPELRYWPHTDYYGEFVGTWVAAAALIAANASDERLMAKVKGLVEEWLTCQQEDGYLGTFAEEHRWRSWDVWVQAHDILGLVAFHEITDDAASLTAAVRVADRLLADFGPGRKSLLDAHSWSQGMDTSAVIEPLLELHRLTGDRRYREFCEWLVDVDWDRPGGPAMLSVLREGGGVADVATGKAAEMLINFQALLALHRATGRPEYLEAVLLARKDIERHHLYITGSASVHENFDPHYRLRNDGCLWIGETCVTSSWIMLNVGLGRLTGEARYFDAAEQAVYNHLLAAQSPDGRGWAYYVGLRDAKRYRWHTDPECCPTRGTRGLAVLPAAAFGTEPGAITVNLYDAASARLPLPGGEGAVTLELETQYPFGPEVRIQLGLERPARFALRLRIPGWCEEWSVTVGEERFAAVDERGYLPIDREWSDRDELHARFEMPPRFVGDLEGNRGKVAVVRGPLVFAADEALLPDNALLEDITIDLDGKLAEVERAESVHLQVPAVSLRPSGPRLGDQRYCEFAGVGRESGHVELVPFFEAGNSVEDAYKDGVHPFKEDNAGLSYQVWLPFVQQPR